MELNRLNSLPQFNLEQFRARVVKHNIKVFFPAAQPLFSLVQTYLLGISKLSGSMPIRSQVVQNWSEQLKNAPSISIPHFLRKLYQ